MKNLLILLREATTSLHQELHVHGLLAPLQSDAITLADYYWCIRAFYQAYSHMAQNIHYYSPIPDVPALDWLGRDIKIHNIKPVLSPVPPYPAIKNYSQYVGYLYVKQGSTLGGRVISKHLQRILGLVPHQTNHFFAGVGEETGERWKQFLCLFEDGTINKDEAVLQAIQTFQLIKNVCDHMYVIKQGSAYPASCG